MMVTLVAEKSCNACGETKPLEEFYRHKKTRDGRNTECKSCAKANAREWQRANPAQAAERKRQWIEENPEKRRAHNAVRDAVEAGRLVKPDRCQDCGEPTASRDLHGHHEDYGKPLDVEWLCVGCHKARHTA